MNLSAYPELYSFIASFQSKRLLIVGNGPSAGKGNQGPQIDAFDVIVRINNYVTEGLEEQVGSRTDIWVNGANQGLIKHTQVPDHILVMIPPVVLARKGDAIQARIQKRLGTKRYTMLPAEIMAEMEASAKIERPTTGFFAIYFFYLMGFDITLHGFDFFVGSTAHYFDSPFKRWLKEKGLIRKAAKHDVGAEKVCIEELIQTGKIKRLAL